MIGQPVPVTDRRPPRTRTHCPYCALQCGMTIGAEGTPAALSIQADAEFPVNRGQMCVKGFTAAALLDHPERVTTPMARRPDGRWATASWEVALREVTGRLERIRAEHGPDAVGVFGSGALTNEKAYLLGKFARVVLRTPHVDYNGRYCMSSAAAGQNRAFGLDRGLPFPLADIARTETLVLWGANGADTMPPIMQWVLEQRDRGGSLVVVDPRRTETARAASLHLQLTPGTDLALANGLLHLAIELGMVDQEYVAARTVGFDEVRRRVLDAHPAHVERVTGISLDQMLRAVRLLGGVPRSMILSGRGPEQQSKGSDTVLALVNLMLALGKVGRPFSGYGCITGQGNGQGGREHGQKADQLPGYRLIEDDGDRRAIAEVWGVRPEDLPRKGKSAYELLDSLGPEGGIRALLVMGSNVAVASPNATHVERRLRALDLLVVCDAFENETSAAAHVFLPTAQWCEEEGTTTNLERRVLLRRHLRPPPAEARTDIQILCDLAREMGEGERFSYASAEEVFDELRRATRGARADYSGITYEKIRAAQGVHWPCPAEDHPGTPRLFADRFSFPDGRARFHAVEHRAAAELPDAEYPLFFTTGRYREHYNSGAQTRRVPALAGARPEPRVEIHPRLAEQLGASEDDVLRVESRRGAVDLRISLSAEIRRDTLFAPFHWGGRAAANVLTIPALDPVSRMPEFKVCAVRAALAPESRRLAALAQGRRSRAALGGRS
ncbi:MAG: molybdopterin oxidoreductase family protein [Myxococcales bacterium]|nr:molybdopterin oxidoreductase family protein [Myxococcales bacterium]